MPGARVTNSVALTQATGTAPVALTFDTERYDTDTIHDTSTNTSRLTCKTAGKYLIQGQVEWQGHATGQRSISIYLNGVTVLAIEREPSVTADTLNLGVSTIYDLAVNDYVELQVWQNSGGDLDVAKTANQSPEFMMQRIG